MDKASVSAFSRRKLLLPLPEPHPSHNLVGIATTVPSHLLLQLGRLSLSHQRTMCIWSRVDKFKFRQDNNNPDSVHYNYIYIIFLRCPTYKKKLVIPWHIIIKNKNSQRFQIKSCINSNRPHLGNKIYRKIISHVYPQLTQQRALQN
jgi:hypothetical protein